MKIKEKSIFQMLNLRRLSKIARIEKFLINRIEVIRFRFIQSFQKYLFFSLIQAFLFYIYISENNAKKCNQGKVQKYKNKRKVHINCF